MKAEEKKVTVKNWKPYEGLSDTEKKKILHEINSGLIGHRAAARKYGTNRNTLSTWIVDFSSFNIKPRKVAEEAIGSMNENSKTRNLVR